MAGANLPIRFKAETLRSISAGSITAGGGAYIGIGTGLANPCRQFKVDNLTDQLLAFSFDGINDHFVLPSNGFFLDDVSSNTALSQGFFLAQGDRLFVRPLGGNPTTGAVYFAVFYGYTG